MIGDLTRFSVGLAARARCHFLGFLAATWLLSGWTGLADEAGSLVGIWASDQGYQVVELLFRANGRYQLDTRSTDPNFDLSSTERGRYQVTGTTLTLFPYEYFGDPQGKPFEFQIAGGSLDLTHLDFPLTETYVFQPGSRESVLAQEQASAELVGTWERHITFYGDTEYTFRPGGYYIQKSSPEGGFPPEYVRGRYERDGATLMIRPYGGIEAQYEVDFFAGTLTVIRAEATSGESATYQLVAGSKAEVTAKSASADTFLASTNWQVGVWTIRDAVQSVDLTLRPDRYYVATNHTQFLEGVVRGRYVLDGRTIHLKPFLGQGLYAKSNGEFGKVERTRTLDYYEGELQFIDEDSISQSVTLAQKEPGSQATVAAKVEQAKAQRDQQGWQVGIWEVNDPEGWMEFTFRPDNRYIAKSGSGGVPYAVERGRCRFETAKITLAPYTGLGSARGFEWDLYDGDLFLIGDLNRMVIARKVTGSEAGVIAKTIDPLALKGERGPILGLWTANLPGASAELVFRDDGQFRLKRCVNQVTSYDYGLYSADSTSRKLVYDSRFVAAQTRELDYYGNTLTIYGGLHTPSTYAVNLGMVNTAINASFAADAADALVDEQWLARVPIGPRDPNAVQLPSGDIPADPNPGSIFPGASVFTGYQFYRRLILGEVYFNVQGTIKSVSVVNTREWHFFPTGRVLVRFKNYRATPVHPITVADVSDSWGAYRIEGKPVEQDILHIYADNALHIETDLGETMDMTLEDGRRHLFWGKDYMLQSEWATEQKPVPCQLPDGADGSLMNTGISLSTPIAPDEIADPQQLRLQISGPNAGNFTISGTTGSDSTLILERATSASQTVVWESVQTNTVSAGPFNFVVPQGSSPAAFFRVRAR